MTRAERTFEIVHSIPSPYRLHLFEVLHRQLQARGLRLHVHFLARSHSDRQHWNGARVSSNFAYTFWRDIGPQYRDKQWHLNPGLIAHLLGAPPAYLMVGGPWDSLTGALLSLRLHHSYSIAWFEGNTKTPGRLGGLSGRIKRRLLAGYNRFAVPGEEGGRLAALIVGSPVGARLAILPNIVDEGRFQGDRLDRKKVRADLELAAGERLAIWPARLIPAKGIVPLVSCLEPADLEGWAIRIVGDGPLRGLIESTLAARALSDKVRLVSAVPYERMPALYAAADLFLLPSLSDPNPLSVVEAMHSGLPIVVSSHIGNCPEALRAGQNGWAVDPKDPEGARTVIRSAFDTRVEELRVMGQRSREIAASFWGSESAVERFLNTVVTDS